MTIGQRIAQRRKALGLSQEQLGAQLGVSRQAIYKWESDAALPEIEKLVTLSRQFSVSVGWLLGEETDAPEGADAGAPADDEGELTEAQLRMVEELARRYQAAQPKRRRWPAVLGCVLACALLLYLFGQLRSVRQFADDVLSQQRPGHRQSVPGVKFPCEQLQTSRLPSFP